MRKLSLFTFVVCLLGASFVLAACGGGGNDDADQIAEQIDFAATSGDPAACTDAQTLKFDEQTTFQNGQAAVASCKKDAASGVADSVDVSDVAVDGNTANATIAVTGGGYDGQTVKISLVKEDGTWKVDSFDEFVNFDPAKFAASFGAEAAKSGGLTPAQLSCLTGKLTSVDAGTVQQAVLSGDPAQLNSLFQGC